MMFRFMVALLYAAGAAMLAAVLYLGDTATALGALAAAAVIAIPTLLLADAKLTRDAEDKLTGGRAADRSFFVREIAERDATHNRQIQEVSYAAGGLAARLELLQAKKRPNMPERLAGRPRDREGRLISLSPEPPSDADAPPRLPQSPR